MFKYFQTKSEQNFYFYWIFQNFQAIQIPLLILIDISVFLINSASWNKLLIKIILKFIKIYKLGKETLTTQLAEPALKIKKMENFDFFSIQLAEFIY